jgi:hypothetical protein
MSMFSSSPADTEQQQHTPNLNFLTSTTLEADPHRAASRRQGEDIESSGHRAAYDTILQRNPFLMRTKLSLPPLPFIHRPKKNVRSQQNHSSSNGIHTSIWSSDEEARRICVGDTNDETQDEQGVQSTRQTDIVRVQTSIRHASHGVA